MSEHPAVRGEGKGGVAGVCEPIGPAHKSRPRLDAVEDEARVHAVAVVEELPGVLGHPRVGEAMGEGRGVPEKASQGTWATLEDQLLGERDAEGLGAQDIQGDAGVGSVGVHRVGVEAWEGDEDHQERDGSDEDPGRDAAHRRLDGGDGSGGQGGRVA